MVNTTPTPAPTPAPSGAQSGSGQQYLDAAGIQLPQLPGGSGAGSKYGLVGSISSANVEPGALFANLASGTGPVTAEQIMDAFAKSSDPAQVAQIQSYLFKAGFYGSKNWSDINIGVINAEDITAFRTAVQTAAQTGSDLSDYLRRQAAWGVYQGISGRINNRSAGASASASSALVIDKPNPTNLIPYIESEYKQLTGRAPTSAEKAGFVAAYTAAYSRIQIDNYNAIHGGPGATGPGGAGDAAPTYGGMVGTPDLVAGGLGNKYLGPASPAQQAQQGLNQSTELGLPDMGVANLIAGGIPAQVDARTAAANQAKYAKDQRFLALADQPMPGMKGAPVGTVSAQSTVAQEQQFDPSAFAEQYVREHSNADVGGHSAADTFQSFLNILKS